MEDLGLSRDFWRDRRVLLTGHTGFKGSWLSLWLQHLGSRVTGFSKDLPTDPSLFEVARVGEGMTAVEGDVRDAGSVDGAMASSEPEVVIHMAAQPLVGRSFEDPVETYETNVMGTVHLLESVRSCPSVRAVLVVTSDKCYENRGLERGYREDEPMGGHDPYSSSKGAAELVTAAYRSSYFAAEGSPAIATARAGNVIGGGDWTEGRLIPDLLAGARGGETVLLRNPDAVRPWQHVLNPLSGYLLLCERLLESGEYAEGWNFGPDQADARPVHWIVDQLGSALGEEIPCAHESAAFEEAQRLHVDSGKAHERLGWRPRWPLDAALDRVAAWDRAHREGADMRERSLEDIAAYEAQPCLSAQS